ncbi:MAG: phospholipase D-like domain-containing protein, partial [Candidatus Bipolaricaulis sp.]|nr:phospholipase D-like domain-containing protein [Candidatus Bipolaricaulis sp.]
MVNRAAVALGLVLFLGIPLVGQVCTTQSYLVSRETAVAAQTAIVQTVDGASRSLDLAVSNLVDGVIADAIVRAIQRGVAVRVILPAAARSEVGGQYSRLLDAGAPLKLSPTP